MGKIIIVHQSDAREARRFKSSANLHDRLTLLIFDSVTNTLKDENGGTPSLSGEHDAILVGLNPKSKQHIAVQYPSIRQNPEKISRITISSTHEFIRRWLDDKETVKFSTLCATAQEQSSQRLFFASNALGEVDNIEETARHRNFIESALDGLVALTKSGGNGGLWVFFKKLGIEWTADSGPVVFDATILWPDGHRQRTQTRQHLLPGHWPRVPRIYFEIRQIQEAGRSSGVYICILFCGPHPASGSYQSSAAS